MNKRQRKKFLTKFDYICSMDDIAFAVNSKVLDYFILELQTFIKQLKRFKRHK